MKTNFSFVNLFIGLLLASFLWNCEKSKQNHKSKDVYNIREFGAVGDSTTLNTKAIQNAIDKASKEGGGKVVIPPGTYLTGGLFLKDNVTFHIMNGATILGSKNRDDYKLIRRPMYRYKDYNPAKGKREDDPLNLKRQHLILIKNAKNVTIKGQGTINGQGKAFWKDVDTTENPQWIMAEEDRVSNMLEVQYSENIKVKEITLTMSPEWTFHMYDSKNITVDDITIDNGNFGPNNDGIDITSCSDVRINNCFIHTSDDAICMKAAPDGGVCQRVSVTNCVIQTHCAAIKTGNNLTHNDIKEITVSNCVINESSRAIGIYAMNGDTMKNMTFNNIVCNTRAPLVLNRPIHISLKEGVDTTSGIENITISNFIARTEGRILITAEEGYKIKNLKLHNIRLDYAFIEDPKPLAPGVKSSQISIKNPEEVAERSAVVVANVENFVLDGLTINWPADTIPKKWKYPVRIENGSFRKTHYDYKTPRQTEFNVFYGRNLEGGYLNIPLAKASSDSKKQIKLLNSNINVKN